MSSPGTRKLTKLLAQLGVSKTKILDLRLGLDAEHIMSRT